MELGRTGLRWLRLKSSCFEQIDVSLMRWLQHSATTRSTSCGWSPETSCLASPRHGEIPVQYQPRCLRMERNPSNPAMASYCRA